MISSYGKPLLKVISHGTYIKFAATDDKEHMIYNFYLRVEDLRFFWLKEYNPDNRSQNIECASKFLAKALLLLWQHTDYLKTVVNLWFICQQGFLR